MLFRRYRLRRRLTRMLWEDAALRLPEMDSRDRRVGELFIRYRMLSASMPYPTVRIHAKIQELQRGIEERSAALSVRRRGSLARARDVHRAALTMEALQKDLAQLLERVTTPSIRMNGHVLTPIEWHSRMMQRQAELGQPVDESAFDPLVQVEIQSGSDDPPELHDAEMMLLMGVGPVAVGGLGTEIDPSLEAIWNAGDKWKPNA